MTDQELFDKVKKEGECWHEPTLPADFGVGIHICKHCGLIHNWLKEQNWNPDFTTWGNFGWLWERMQEHERWEEVAHKYGSYVRSDRLEIRASLVHPTRFRDALKEFFAEDGE